MLLPFVFISSTCPSSPQDLTIPLDLSAATLAFTRYTGDLFVYRVSPSHYPDFTPNYSLTIG